MAQTQNKIVSIEAFRAMRPAERLTGTIFRGPVSARRYPSARSIAHRERMLRFLRTEAVEARQAQGRLLL